MHEFINNSNVITKDNECRFVSLIYAFSPILVIYSSFVPGLAINELIVALLFILAIISRPKKLFVVNSYALPLIFFVFYGTCVTLGVIFTESWSQPNIMIYDLFSKILFLIIFLVGVQFINFDYFLKHIIILADISVAFLILQVILGFVGFHMSGIVPFLPLSNEVDTSQFISGQLESERICSIFSEPAHLSEFLLLPLIIELFSNKQNTLRILLYSTAIIMSKSTTGFSVLGVILIFFLIYKLKKTRRKGIRILMIVAISVVSLGIAPFFIIIFGDTLNRFTEISGEANGLFSGYIRVVRGYILFDEFCSADKAFGQGFGCLLGYISSHKTAYLDLTDKIPEYVNSIQYILITSGIIGFVIIFKFIYSIFIRCSFQFKMVLVALIVMTTSSSIFFSTTGCLYLIASIRSIDYFKIERNNQRGVALI